MKKKTSIKQTSLKKGVKKTSYKKSAKVAKKSSSTQSTKFAKKTSSTQPAKLTKKTSSKQPAKPIQKESFREPGKSTKKVSSRHPVLHHQPYPFEHIRTLSKERILPYLAGAILIAASVMVFIVYRSYAWSAFIAMLFYVGFDGINRRFNTIFHGSRNLAAGVSTLIVVLIILVPVFLILRHLIGEIISLIVHIRNSLTDETLMNIVQNYPSLASFFTAEPFFWVNLSSEYRSFVGEYSKILDPDQIGAWLGNAYSVVSGGISITAEMTGNLLLGIIILFFLFRDGPQFYSFLEEALPFPPVITSRFVSRMTEIIRAVLRGNVFVSILQGTAVAVGLSICGISNSAVFAVIAAVCSLIPIIGTAIVWIPVVAYLVFVEGTYGLAIFLMVWCLVFYLFLENIFKPKILDRTLGIHPLFLFLAIIGGITEFGITGVILGPLFVTLFITIWSIYHIWDSKEKQHEGDEQSDIVQT